MYQHPRNKERAERARKALGAYIGTDEADTCHPQDLVTDLLHLVDADEEYKGYYTEPSRLWLLALDNYERELRHPED